MLNNEYITYAIIAVGIFTVYMAIMHLFRSDNMQERVKNAIDSSYAAETSESAAPGLAQFCTRVLRAIRVDPNAQKDLGLQLARAGISSPFAITYFLFFKWIVQPILAVTGFVILLKSFSGGGAIVVMLRLFMAGVLLVAGLYGAKIFVSNRKQKRMQVLLYSFPETLDLLLVCIESGLGLDAALNRVCKELRDMHPDVVAELDRTRLELTMLNDRVLALQNLAERVEVIPFKTLVSALIQTEKFGTSLVDTLRVLSEEMRMTRLFSAEQKAARIPVLITIPLIICILPAFIMIIIAPPLIKVINNGGIFGSSIATPKK